MQLHEYKKLRLSKIVMIAVGNPNNLWWVYLVRLYVWCLDFNAVFEIYNSPTPNAALAPGVAADKRKAEKAAEKAAAKAAGKAQPKKSNKRKAQQNWEQEAEAPEEWPEEWPVEEDLEVDGDSLDPDDDNMSG